jgi:hypothetical protein
MYTAIFTPYVAAFLLNEPDFSTRKSKKYGDDPIVIIDLIGMTNDSITIIELMCMSYVARKSLFWELISSGCFQSIIDTAFYIYSAGDIDLVFGHRIAVFIFAECTTL